MQETLAVWISMFSVSLLNLLDFCSAHRKIYENVLETEATYKPRPSVQRTSKSVLGDEEGCSPQGKTRRFGISCCIFLFYLVCHILYRFIHGFCGPSCQNLVCIADESSLSLLESDRCLLLYASDTFRFSVWLDRS